MTIGKTGGILLAILFDAQKVEYFSTGCRFSFEINVRDFFISKLIVLRKAEIMK
jgi:hypothetical protein